MNGQWGLLQWGLEWDKARSSSRGSQQSLEQEMEWSVRSKWGLECVMARSEGSQGSLV